VRRRCVLDVGPQLISDIVDVGYDEAMGARGLKRAIEHNFTHPVAVELASIRSETPTLITVRKKNSVAGDDARLDVNVVPLINADPVQQGTLDSDEELLQASIDFLERIEAESFASRPEGEISGSGMSPELLHYFALVEHANEIRETISKLRERIDSPTPSAPPALPVSQGRRSGSRNNKHYSELPSKTLRRDLSAVGEIRHFLSDATLTDRKRFGRSGIRKTKCNPCMSRGRRSFASCCNILSTKRSRKICRSMESTFALSMRRAVV